MHNLRVAPLALAAISVTRLGLEVRTFPWAPWLVFVALALWSSYVSYLTWRGRGPASWYGREFRDYRSLVLANQLPVAVMFIAASLAVVFRFEGIRHEGQGVGEIANVAAWLLVCLGAVSALAMVSTFLFSFPQWLIAPPFRKEADASEFGRRD